MRLVNLAEVKDRLSKYLRMAEKEEIVITRHGKPAGILIGFASKDDWFYYRLEMTLVFWRGSLLLKKACWPAGEYGSKTCRSDRHIGEMQSPMHTNRLLVLTGGIFLIIGSRLPWISVPVLFGVEGPAFEAIEVGWEDNGILTGLIGLMLLVLWAFVKGRAGRRYSHPGATLAALAALDVAGCFQRILEIDPAAGFFAATDFGIYVTLLGALLALTGALLKAPTNLEAKRAIPLSGARY